MKSSTRRMLRPRNWVAGRMESRARRRRLTAPPLVRFSAREAPNLHIFDQHPPVECVMEATDTTGGLNAWCRPEFFRRMLDGWGDSMMTLRLAATPGAILHEHLLTELGRLKDKAPDWEIVVETDGNGLASMAALDALLKAPYHEIVFKVGTLPGGGQPGEDHAWPKRVFDTMRELVALRKERGQGEPAVVWQFTADNPGPEELQRAETLARQMCVDRFVKTDKVQSQP